MHLKARKTYSCQVNENSAEGEKPTFMSGGQYTRTRGHVRRYAPVSIKSGISTTWHDTNVSQAPRKYWLPTLRLSTPRHGRRTAESTTLALGHVHKSKGQVAKQLARLQSVPLELEKELDTGEGSNVDVPLSVATVNQSLLGEICHSHAGQGVPCPTKTVR